MKWTGFRQLAVILGVFFTLTASAHAADGWPREIKTSRGTITLQHAPQRIVSTSVTVTGTLLAIDAPVVASGATSPNTRIADAQGFFRQWGDVAKQRGVQRLYIGEPNAEAIAGAAPDLIVVAATGGDSAIKLYDQLSAVAPVLVVNYDDKSWQELAQELGQATGKEDQAVKAVARFDAREKAVKASIHLPPQPVSALVYRPDGKAANLWTPASPQGQMLQQLGFTLAQPPANAASGQSQGVRKDILQLAGENMAAGLNGKTLLLFAGDKNDVQRVEGNVFLSHLPAVQGKQVYALGDDTFRLDYYSASNVLTQLEKQFSSH
ncbi:Fe2+-enterobactin ABC transporter substrate-binding protein [Rouxiella badensis]|jgi:ABC-type Fe2+-enterobactin transport system substrate-binding protein|uniref:Fe2+-enterobactin ABC transporter substrate-binding protein n=1 Tax=Rouxiella badensis TaxID=1646377 RepID=UPI0028D4C487|nr:Fe2+-enterobactin ABC transporter substrate-binding protein [Rouxiella badensis]